MTDAQVNETALPSSSKDISAKSIGIHTRSSSPSGFDWKTKCFICGESCSAKHRNTWSQVQYIDQDPHGRSIYNSVLEAARLRGDDVVMTRLLGIGNNDMVAVKARYHRKKGCLSSYISTRSLSALKRQPAKESEHSEVLCASISEYKQKIVQERQVFLFSSIRERFNELHVGSKGECSSYSSQTLKQKLQALCPELAFIPQKGKSDIVCCADVSVGEVMKKALSISLAMKEKPSYPEEPSISFRDGDEDSDESIIHRAVSKLRKRLECTSSLDKEYYSSNEMTLLSQKQFVDPLLLKTICWLTNKNHFKNGTYSESDSKCLSIACDITTLATSILSPKHVGLSVYLLHEYESMKAGSL